MLGLGNCWAHAHVIYTMHVLTDNCKKKKLTVQHMAVCLSLNDVFFNKYKGLEFVDYKCMWTSAPQADLTRLRGEKKAVDPV